MCNRFHKITKYDKNIYICKSYLHKDALELYT